MALSGGAGSLHVEKLMWTTKIKFKKIIISDCEKMITLNNKLWVFLVSWFTFILDGDDVVHTLYNAILRIARNFLETKESIKISTHPFYHVNLD